MIIPKADRLQPNELKEIEEIAKDFDCSILEIHGRNRCVYAILGDENHAVMFKRIAGLPYIGKVAMIESSYKLMNRQSGLSDHIVRMGETEVGMEAPFVIGGPCTIDPANPSLYLETAHALKEAGVDALRGGVWKPRTNPYSYQGEPEVIPIKLEKVLLQ